MIEEYLSIVGKFAVDNFYRLLAVIGGLILIKILLKYIFWIIGIILLVSLIYYLLVYTDIGVGTITTFLNW